MSYTHVTVYACKMFLYVIVDSTVNARIM